jgi:hypothetical protein
MFENGQFFRNCIQNLQKSANMTQTNFFLAKNPNVCQKMQNFMLISNLLMQALENAPKNVISRKPQKKVSYFFIYNLF